MVSAGIVHAAIGGAIVPGRTAARTRRASGRFRLQVGVWVVGSSVPGNGMLMGDWRRAMRAASTLARRGVDRGVDANSEVSISRQRRPLANSAARWDVEVYYRQDSGKH